MKQNNMLALKAFSWNVVVLVLAILNDFANSEPFKAIVSIGLFLSLCVLVTYTIMLFTQLIKGNRT